VARSEGWIAEDLAGPRMGPADEPAKWLKWVRNLIHPGRFVRETPSGAQFEAGTAEDAYHALNRVWEQATAALDEMLAAAFERRVPPSIRPPETKSAD
jgi:hypothetical protein